MSLLPAFFNARKRRNDAAPPAEAETESRTGDSPRDDSGENVFDLVPPPKPANDTEPGKAAAGSRNVHPIGMDDLSRLSIDRDGRLYWDGKPVEVRRRILMSRAQVAGATLVAAFVLVAAAGAAIQGTLAARDWACRLGWTTNYCTLPDLKPQNASDIPA